MIHSIKIDSKEVILRDSKDESLNIYDIDSISLLIGKNGTGKTLFFSEIINAFKSTHKNKFSSDCEVSFFNTLDIDSWQEMRKWGIVYYSPIPFRQRIHDSANFKDASPNFGRVLKATVLNECKDIIDFFGINPNGTIECKFNRRNLIKSILDEIFNLRLKKIKSILFPHTLINDIYNLSTDIKKSISDVDNEDTDYRSDLIRKRDMLIHDLTDEIRLDLNKKKDAIDLLSFYIALNGLKKKAKLTKSATISIFSSFLNNDSSSSAVDTKAIRLFWVEKNKIESFLSKFHNEIINEDNIIIPADPYYADELIHKGEVSDYFSLNFNSMSSGQLALIHQLSIIFKSISDMYDKGYNKILLLVDEGDAFLHLEWQRNYIYKLNELLGKLKISKGISCLQTILASHSPLLATDVPRKNICTMDKPEAKSGFASPIHHLLNDSFGAKTIGEFASQKINATVRNLKRTRTQKISSGDAHVISIIDNEILKREINKIIPFEGEE